MKKLIFLLLITATIVSSQKLTQTNVNQVSGNAILLNQSDLIQVTSTFKKKILSGKLINSLSRKKVISQNSIQSTEIARENVVIYMSEYPTIEQINQLEQRNVICYLNLWTPPMDNHLYGFFIASMPVTELNNTLAFAFVKKMDTAEYECFPQNNSAAIAINSDDVWLEGYDGTGVTVAVLDSGVDTSYAGTELPVTFQKKDYSSYPTLDNDVANITSGHGTHVTGSVLGRGTLSSGRNNDGNGTTAFKGSAPDADLVFLKIGGDASSSASSVAMIAAMNDAVSVYDADILTMSYGGWYTYHDGSSATEQKVDWVCSQGVPFFISAGNSANDAQHYSGTVGANSSTGLIAVNTQNGSALTFNLVWYDGIATSNNLSMKYYDTDGITELTNTAQHATTESDRGTESKFSNYNATVSAGTYYVKVVNTSSNSQFFHIYFDNWGYPSINFASPDQEYTIGQPASADSAFAVAAWTTRSTWYDYSGSGWSYGNTLDDIAPFSSRGPRVDGGVTKPNIAAPGAAILSLRDTDVYTSADAYWIDNDGTTSAGDANYYQMQGTSMACPIAAGAAALLLDKYPTATPSQIYAAIQNSASTSGTGAVPNSTWGYGKLDILAALNNSAVPVQLSSFSASINGDNIILNWTTATEVNNYGFEIQLKSDFDNEWNNIGFVEGHGNSNSPNIYSYIDNSSEAGNLKYRLKQIDTDGMFEYSD